MKIVSWNVNGIRAVAKKGFISIVDQLQPDILCLQETKAHKEQVELAIQNPLGKIGHWSSAVRPGYSGTATFSKLETLSCSKGIQIRKFDSEGRFVITDHKDFLLYNMYFPNGGSGQERHDFKQEFLLQFLRHLKKVLASGREVIVVGDYNIAHKEMDVYDPVRLSKESGFLPEERAWMDQFFALGMVDAFRHFHPDEKHRYSWWSYRENARLGNRGWRIDYICVSTGLVSQLKSCQILDSVEGSDHCPVMLEME
jgi:exodeoxyribonuclease-3